MNVLASLEDLNGEMARVLFAELTRSRSWSDALRILVGAAKRQVRRHADAWSPTRDFVAAVRAAPSGNPIQWAAEQLSISSRHMRRVFDRELGISPKRFTRVLRFLRTMRAADSLARPPWARLAYEFGYADQAHLINESRALVGHTPAMIHRARRAEDEALAKVDGD